MTERNKFKLESLALRFTAVAFLGLLNCFAIYAQAAEARPTLVRDPIQPSLSGGQNDKAPVRANSVLQGRVIYSDSQRPVSRAQIKLFGVEPAQAPIYAATDRNGEFVINGLVAGKYSVTAESPGALSREMSETFTQTEKKETATKTEKETASEETTVTLNGADTRDVTVLMTHGGAITGHILYSDGEPVTFARLTLFRQTKQGLVPFGISDNRTDDRGGYRLEEVPPGDYAVGVVDTISTEIGRGVVTVYHPKATNAQDATLVKVTAGGEVVNVDLTVPINGLRKASGTVIWKKTGNPVANAVVLLRRTDEKHLNQTATEIANGLSGKSSTNLELSLLAARAGRSNESNNAFPAKTDDEGHWLAADLPAGEYRLEISAKLPPEENSRKPTVSQETDPFEVMASYLESSVNHTQNITLRDGDAEDVAVELTEGSAISGIILDINGAPPANPISVIATNQGTSEQSQTVVAVSKPDGTFRLRGLSAGEFHLRVRFMVGNDGPRYIRSINYGGVDLTKQPITVTINSEISGLQVRLGNEFATIQGRVLTSAGSPAAGVSVLIVNKDRNSFLDLSRFNVGHTDANGNFTAKVVPGEYSVLPEPDITELQTLGANWLNTGQSVNATFGQPVSIEIKLKPTPAPKP